MTVTPVPVDEEPHEGSEIAARPNSPASRKNRALLIVVTIASVLPFFWAAIRDARGGFYPTSDVAATVLRSRDVFSSHPPLVGMWSSGSTWAGQEIHFPGAIQLYLLAIPIQVLGNVWGPLLTMATLNAFWVLLAGWLVYRRLGTNAALLAFLSLTVFMWSIGSENLIDPRPMEMVTIPFLCFLFAVWLVTSGDIDTLPGLAIVANFLFLDHLVQALQIPVIGLCAFVGVVIWVRRTRRAPAPDRPPQYGRLRRRLFQAGGITLVMWLPSLIEQFTNPPGNLRLLVEATGQHREPVGSFVVGYNTVVRIIATPPFWFRGRFNQDVFHRGLETLGPGDVVAGIILVGVLGFLFLMARRRGDRTVLAVIGVSVVAILISIVTVVQSPGIWGFLPYVRSVWALAAFVWFAAAFGVWRLFAESIRARLSQVAGVGAVVFCILALSFADFGAMTDMRGGPFARNLVDATVPQLTDRGKVLVRSAPDFASERYFTALLLGLHAAGVHYCVEGIAVAQFGTFHDCGEDAEVSVLVRAGALPDDTDLAVLSRTEPLTPAEQRRLDEAVRVSEEWLTSHDRVALTPHGRALADARDQGSQSLGGGPFAPADGDLSGLMDSATFRLFLRAQATHLAAPDEQEAFFADPDLPLTEMITWLEFIEGFDPIFVYETPVR